MLVCTSGSAVYVEFASTYLTDSFLMALRRFICLRGTPSKIQSDRGKQLLAPPKHLKAWDFMEVIELAGKKG
jgi:hypothetical protein